MVAHTRMKTPTAVAAFLIGQMDGQAEILNGLQQWIVTKVSEILSGSQAELKWVAAQFPYKVTSVVEHNRTRLGLLSKNLSVAHLLVEKQQSALAKIKQDLLNRLLTLFAGKNQELYLHEQFLKMASPDYILRKGYTLTLKEGKTVKRASDLTAGDEITTRFTDGERRMVVK
jgi:exodeoxyribonuclease VII large subunit